MTPGPWRDGMYRCPYKCGDPNYPQRKWKTLEGFEKHLRECKAKPDVPAMPPPRPRKIREKHSDCPDCGAEILHGETIWWMRDKIVCLACYRPYHAIGRGHLEGAGIELMDYSGVA